VCLLHTDGRIGCHSNRKSAFLRARPGSKVGPFLA